MKRITILVVALALVSSFAFAAGKTYQFTGTVLEVKGDVVIVEKTTGGKKEKFELTKDANTKIKGDLKAGSKVTVKYESRAAEIEVKK